jgi:hypothetical protein
MRWGFLLPKNDICNMGELEINISPLDIIQFHPINNIIYNIF